MRAMVLDRPGQPLEDARQALEDARAGRIEGSAVLVVPA
jgi:hypothetical protein